MGLLLIPSGQLIAVALANADISDASVPAHFSERRLACIKPGANLFGCEPLFLLTRRTMILGDGAFYEVAALSKRVVHHK